MSDHIIDIDPLNPFDVLKASMQYRRLRKEWDAKVDIFLQRIAERGREVLDAAGYNGESVTVTVDEIDDGYCINAAGKGIVFLEFGAGDAVNSGNRYADMMPFEVRPGSYSETHGQQYSTFGKWVFGGMVYHEIVPRNGMQTAWETIMQEWRSIAEEVFS